MRPPADVAIDGDLVGSLVAEQHADLAHLPTTDAGEGWDCRLFRLGESMVVRLPRRAQAAEMLASEQRWLPGLASRLPLPTSAPVRLGRPSNRFPYCWSISRWLPGRPALAEPPRDRHQAAVDLGAFLEALHQPAPAGAPSNPWRGVPLAQRDGLLHSHVAQAGTQVDRGAVLGLWRRAIEARPWSRPTVWIHGDLHPGNLIVDDGRLVAVVDFVDLCAGDPATDLAVMWMLFDSDAREAFLASASPRRPVDPDTRLRSRGWALALGLALSTQADDDPALREMGKRAVEAALVG